jgi:hypothetical protein
MLSGVILLKLGFNRHTPSAIVYAPRHFEGIGLRDLHTEQGLAHLLFVNTSGILHGHSRIDNPTIRRHETTTVHHSSMDRHTENIPPTYNLQNLHTIPNMLQVDTPE